jgi:hypothetical protein
MQERASIGGHGAVLHAEPGGYVPVALKLRSPARPDNRHITG